MPEIQRSGLEDALGRAAAERTAGAGWLFKEHRVKRGVGVVELLDDEWLPAYAFLTPAAKNTSPFHEAVDMDDVASVAMLLRQGDVDTADRQQALFLALTSGDSCMTKALLKDPGDANLLDGQGYALLMEAVRDGTASNVKVFLTAGADPNARTARGETALSIAEHNRNDELANLPKAAGATR